MKTVVFDLETGGLDAKTNAIVSGAAIVLNQELQEIVKFYAVVNEPEKLVTPEALQVNGLTLDEIREGLPIEEFTEIVKTLSKDAIMVCHNAAFDLGFMNARGLGFTHAIDTMFLSWAKWPGQKAKLSMVCERVGIPVVNAHNSLADVEMTVNLLRYFAAGSGDGLSPSPINWDWQNRRFGLRS